MSKPRLFISFSGGRTSAYMTKRLLGERKESHDIVVLFANTGLEHEETLRFVDRCDRELGFGVVWVEAVVHPTKRVGTTHRVVDYMTASRKGEPFEAVIAKYGIPNQDYPHCTREAKLRPMTKYLRSIGWGPGSYTTAIGIRADEVDRMDPSFEKERFWYPLIRWEINKADVIAWWRRQPFDLCLREHHGNCVTCWKKSDRKLLTLAKEDPQHFRFFYEMERRYENAGAGDAARAFYRGHQSAAMVVGRSIIEDFAPFSEEAPQSDPRLDVGGACGDGCEIGADGNGDEDIEGPSQMRLEDILGETGAEA